MTPAPALSGRRTVTLQSRLAEVERWASPGTTFSSSPALKSRPPRRRRPLHRCACPTWRASRRRTPRSSGRPPRRARLPTSTARRRSRRRRTATPCSRSPTCCRTSTSARCRPTSSASRSWWRSTPPASRSTEIVEDAVRRDRALDTYERVLQKHLDELRAEKQAENARSKTKSTSGSRSCAAASTRTLRKWRSEARRAAGVARPQAAGRRPHRRRGAALRVGEPDHDRRGARQTDKGGADVR